MCAIIGTIIGGVASALTTAGGAITTAAATIGTAASAAGAAIGGAAAGIGSAVVGGLSTIGTSVAGAVGITGLSTGASAVIGAGTLGLASGAIFMLGNSISNLKNSGNDTSYVGVNEQLEQAIQDVSNTTNLNPQATQAETVRTLDDSKKRKRELSSLRIPLVSIYNTSGTGLNIEGESGVGLNI